MGKFRCLSCKSEFDLEEKAAAMRCPRCGSRFVEVIDAANWKRGMSWRKSFAESSQKRMSVSGKSSWRKLPWPWRT